MSDLPRPCLAVVPARGGSKGLPGKNIRPLAGLPLIEHSIRCAALAKSVDRTIVSTDDERIASIARDAGASVPFIRPAELATDTASMMSVVVHALAEIERLESRRYGSVLLLDPTSPGRLPEEIDAAVAVLTSDPDCQGVVACSRPTFNPFWVGVVADGEYMAPAVPGANRFSRRQDVPPFYRINGSLYLWRATFIRKGPETWRDHPHRILETAEQRALSIDDEYEFKLAELLVESGLVPFPWLSR